MNIQTRTSGVQVNIDTDVNQPFLVGSDFFYFTIIEFNKLFNKKTEFCLSLQQGHVNRADQFSERSVVPLSSYAEKTDFYFVMVLS